MNRWRATLYRHLEPRAKEGGGLSRVNRLIASVIVVAALFAILETEEALRVQGGTLFIVAEVIFVVIFSIEYLARLYAAGEDVRYRGVIGRIRYLFSFWAIIDLLAILPFFLTAGAHNAFLLRLFRLLRLLRLSKLGRFSKAWDLVAESIANRKYELALSMGLAALLLLFSSSFLYVLEAEHQPEAFGSIPRALWWSIATLTTVGYGDVVPITVLGKIFAGFTALAGIGMIAMPTGILAAAFSDAMRKHKTQSASPKQPDPTTANRSG